MCFDVSQARFYLIRSRWTRFRAGCSATICVRLSRLCSSLASAQVFAQKVSLHKKSLEIRTFCAKPLEGLPSSVRSVIDESEPCSATFAPVCQAARSPHPEPPRCYRTRLPRGPTGTESPWLVSSTLSFSTKTNLRNRRPHTPGTSRLALPAGCQRSTGRRAARVSSRRRRGA